MDSENRLIVSHLTLRQLLGWMGISLPFLLVLLNWIIFREDLETSISAYYHIKYVGAVLVGVLFAIGVFLLAYKGYPLLNTDKAYEFSDNVVGNFAGVFAIGVAFFPTRPENASDLDRIFGIVHFACAGLFLAALAYFAFFLFTKTYPDTVTHPITYVQQREKERRKKKYRNLVYRFCGIVIGLCIVLLIVNFLIGDVIQAIKPVFWLEAIAVVAFGLSWLVKGEALLGDPR